MALNNIFFYILFEIINDFKKNNKKEKYLKL